jgi:hypothetical protein
VSYPSEPTELIYTRRTATWSDWLPPVAPERWDIADANGTLVMNVIETGLGAAAVAARLLWQTNTWTSPKKLYRRMAVRDAAGRDLLSIVRLAPRLRGDDGEVRTPEGELIGALGVVELDHYPPRPQVGRHPSPPLGIGLLDARRRRVGEVARTKPFGPTCEIHDADGVELATFTATRDGADGYRLHLGQRLPEPLRSLVLAAPIVTHFMGSGAPQ